MTDTRTEQTQAMPAITFRPSSLWRRLAGLVYDLVAVVAIIMVVGMICMAATRGQLVQTGAQVDTAWWYRPLQYLIVAAYFAVSWLRGGQTLGMRPWRMRLRMINGDPIRLSAAIIRIIVASLPILLLAIAHAASPRAAMWAVLIAWTVYYAMALCNRRHRTLHDIVAGTELVHVVEPKRRRKRQSQ